MTVGFDTMTLGEIIDRVKRANADAQVIYDFADLSPTGIYSYRGFYEDLAIGYETDGYVDAKAFLDLLNSAVGKTFTGYKGGDYRMTRKTPVWVARHDRAPSTAVSSIELEDYHVVICTKRLEV